MKLPRADLRVSGVLVKPALLACTSDRDLWARCAVNSFNGIANFVVARWSALALYGLPLAPLECWLMAQSGHPTVAPQCPLSGVKEAFNFELMAVQAPHLSRQASPTKG